MRERESLRPYCFKACGCLDVNSMGGKPGKALARRAYAVCQST